MIIGARGSALAQTQAIYVADALRRRLELEPEMKVIRTQGDIVTDRPLRELEGRGYFTKEIEEALLAKEIDLAVHSFKDIPSTSPEGLEIAAITVREDPADLLIVRASAYDEQAAGLPLIEGAQVGTSAVRREQQALALRADLRMSDLRGNVPTRLEKLRNGDYDAIFLAAAGLNRLGIEIKNMITIRMAPDKFVPAPGQGALAVQMRADDSRLASIRAVLNHDPTAIATRYERALQARFGGGCGLPLGAYANFTEGDWILRAFWGGEHEPRWCSASDEDPFAAADVAYAMLTEAQ